MQTAIISVDGERPRGKKAADQSTKELFVETGAAAEEWAKQLVRLLDRRKTLGGE